LRETFKEKVWDAPILIPLSHYFDTKQLLRESQTELGLETWIWWRESSEGPGRWSRDWSI